MPHGKNADGNHYRNSPSTPEGIDYEYYNRDGSYYVRYTDGSATFHGLCKTVDYPAPQPSSPADEAEAEAQDHTEPSSADA